mgnify:CR=1 FL=1
MEHIHTNTERQESESHVPGEPSFWVFIVGEMVMFSVMYLVFICHRFWTPENLLIFEAGQRTLSQFYGALNTILLLTSSWFIVLGLKAARDGNSSEGKAFVKLTFMCGLGFVFVKVLEYTEKVQAGYLLNTDAFFQIYYMYTTLHLMHVLVGLVALMYLIKNCFKSDCNDENNIAIIEGVACFWHVVDLLWIGLFTLIYLVV